MAADSIHDFSMLFLLSFSTLILLMQNVASWLEICPTKELLLHPLPRTIFDLEMLLSLLIPSKNENPPQNWHSG